MPSPLTTTPRSLPALPSRGVSAILAAGMLAAGIALGALIGPAPANSLASAGRAAGVARVLALLALGDGAAAGSQLPANAGHAAASAARQSAGEGAGAAARSGASAAGSAHRAAGGGASETNSTPSSSPGNSPSLGSASPTKGASSPGGSSEPKPARLAPVAHVWLIVLPYGASFANLTGEPTSAPYTTGALVHRGTLLSSYSSLAASQLAGAAALLSGQVAAAVNTIVAPCAGGQGAAPQTAPSAAAGVPGTSTAGAAPAASGVSSCASAEPAGAQAADGFLHEVVPRIEASAGYREGGLIAITFAASGEGAGASGPGSAGAPTSGPSSSPAIAYPAGAQVSTSTATGTPGALLLSPFLARPGARLQSAFDQLAPRKSVEELLRDPSEH